MNQAVRIFKNDHFNAAIMVQIGNKDHNRIEEVGKDVLLYADEELVGLNIFCSDLFKEKNGFIRPNKENLKILNAYLESKGIESLNFDNDKVLHVAQVKTVEAVEGSDSLSLCQVMTDQGEKQIVCGAQNVKEGMKTIVALDQAVLFDGTLIEDGKLFDQESFGMLCSAKELGLDKVKQQEGIIELKEDIAIGTAFSAIDWSDY